MKVFGVEKLYRFMKKHAEARSRVESWLAIAKDAEWHTPADVKEWDASASILEDNRVIFDLSRQYRIEVRIAYKNQVIVILNVGTHDEYNRW